MLVGLAGAVCTVHGSITVPLYHIVCMEQDSRTGERAKRSVGSVKGPKLNETDLTSARKDGSLAFPFLHSWLPTATTAAAIVTMMVSI